MGRGKAAPGTAVSGAAAGSGTAGSGTAGFAVGLSARAATEGDGGTRGTPGCPVWAWLRFAARSRSPRNAARISSMRLRSFIVRRFVGPCATPAGGARLVRVLPGAAATGSTSASASVLKVSSPPALAEVAVRVEEQLYGASSETLLERIRTVPDEVGSVLLIGHNPGLRDFALMLLARSRTRAPRSQAPDRRACDARARALERLSPGDAELVAYVGSQAAPLSSLSAPKIRSVCEAVGVLIRFACKLVRSERPT